METILDHHFGKDIFSAEERSIILPCYTPRKMARGDYFLREGNRANHYWFIETGVARAYVIDQKGKDISTHFFTRGDIIIDWSSFFMRTSSLENITALSDCTCYELDFDSFQTLFHSIPAFREEGRSRFVRSYFAVKSSSISHITLSAKERYLKLLADKPEIVQNIPLKHIASFLGITDTSLSRIRKEVAQVG